MTLFINNPVNINILGDSLSYRSNAFGLQDKLGGDFMIHNYSIDGRTTRDWLLEINRAFEVIPDIFIIELGINDAIQYNPEEFQKNIQSLINEVNQRSQAKVFLTRMPLSEETSIQSDIKTNNRWIDSNRNSLNVRVVDLESIFEQKKIELDLYPLTDPIHPNPIGYELIGNEYRKEILSYLSGG